MAYQFRQDSEDFDSPESAAMFGFPPEHVRVIAARLNGDHAYVLLNTGSDVQPYQYGADCFRQNGRWREGSSGNAPGRARTGEDSEVGILSFWGDAPAAVDMVKVEFQGALIEVPVANGAYLAVWWNVSPQDWPRVVSVRRSGRWIPSSRTEKAG